MLTIFPLPLIALLGQAVPIRISGATGTVAAIVNGIYDPTREISSGGCYSYEKRGDSTMWLEMHECLWIVKSTSAKGTGSGWASLVCDGLKALEKCTGTWRVIDSGALIEQASVRVVVVPCLVSVE